MKPIAVAGAALLALAGLATWWIEAASTHILQAHYDMPGDALRVPVAGSDTGNGSRLAHLNGCFSCHGDGLTGHIVYAGSFGSRLTAPNLTRIVRHRTDAQLAAAIRYGVKPDGTSLVGMPAGNFIKSSDSDTAAIIAYLRTLPQRPNAAPDTVWGFGGRVMLASGLFPPEAKLVNRAARGPRMTPAGSPPLGRYIAQSQCAVCHGRDFSGDPDVHSPDLRVVIPHYSLAAFQRFFVTGEGRKGHDTRIMAEIIKRRLHYLAPAETAALYAYLKAPSPALQK